MLRHGVLLVALLLVAVPAAAQVAGAGPTETPTATPAADQAPPLSELEQLRVENHLLRLRVVQLETQAQTAALSEERTRLEQALAAAHAGWRMDWQAGQLVRVEAADPNDEEP